MFRLHFVDAARETFLRLTKKVVLKTTKRLEQIFERHIFITLCEEARTSNAKSVTFIDDASKSEIGGLFAGW